MDLTLVPLSDLVAEVRRRSMIVRAAKKQASPLTHQELISVISYDPVSGVFFKLGAAGDGAPGVRRYLSCLGCRSRELV